MTISRDNLTGQFRVTFWLAQIELFAPGGHGHFAPAYRSRHGGTAHIPRLPRTAPSPKRGCVQKKVDLKAYIFTAKKFAWKLGQRFVWRRVSQNGEEPWIGKTME
jgi:hypothetical protein